MNGYHQTSSYDYFPEATSVFGRALAMGLILHLVVLLFILFPPQPPKVLVIPIGYMDLDYDPLGGEPGGDQGDGLTAAPLEAPEPLPLPEPEPEPEPELFEEEDLAVIESLSEKAVEIPPPPPPPTETAEKPKPKPKPQPTEPPRATAGIADGNQTGGAPGPGGGGGPGLGQGGAGGGTGRGTADPLAAYKSQVRRKLERYRKYPPSARSSRLEGVVQVSFTINRQGQVVAFKMLGSSGHAILDEEAAALIRRINPLPAFPSELQSLNTLELTVPIKFALR
ncbi:MAG: energy transducer TonB [Deltaproteobacteria bacterium]|jgi:protein TonB|nr:energy transducer TonB [Deltaproteobacteria bacterium]